MRKLQIDFVRKPRPSAGGWLLLVAGVAAVAVLAQVQLELSQQHAAQAARLAALQAPGGPGAQLAAADKSDDPLVVAARQALERSRPPWQSLFSALEAADGADVALLAVTPEPQRRQVKIHAEARDLAAMLAFHRELQQQPSLSHVVLLDHTVVKDVPETPVRFHLSAQWGAVHGQP